MNIFHLHQAAAFLDYSRRLVEESFDWRDLFNGWSNGKDFLPQDREIIFGLVKEYYLKKAELKKEKKSRRCNKWF